MKTLIDFLSLIVFFALYKLYDIQIATMGLIITSVIQIILLKLIYKKVTKQELITTIVILVFGTITLLLHNPIYLQWKVTIANFIFGIAIIVSCFMGKNISRKLLGDNFKAETKIWHRINYSWAAFFMAIGLVNIYIAYNMSMNFWVNFKVFGILGCTLGALILTVIYLFAHAKK